MFNFILGILYLSFIHPVYAQDVPIITEKEKYYQCTVTNLKGSPEYKNCMLKAAEYLVEYEFEKSILECESALKYKTNDFLARALICLNYYEIGEQLDIKIGDNKSKRKEIYNKMIDVAEQGIEAAPNQGECYFMRGLARARKATTAGVIYELFTARSIEKDWLKAAELKSEYVTPTGEDLLASCYLGLGAYYRLCPSFFLLSLIFGISGDLDKSVLYCEKAYKIDPQRIEIVKELGISYITRGLDNEDKKEIEKGKEYLKIVPTLPLRLKTDPIDIEHSKMLLDDIELCPGYSRDQQQEISEEAVEKAYKEKKQQEKEK